MLQRLRTITPQSPNTVLGPGERLQNWHQSICSQVHPIVNPSWLICHKNPVPQVKKFINHTISTLLTDHLRSTRPSIIVTFPKSYLHTTQSGLNSPRYPNTENVVSRRQRCAPAGHLLHHHVAYPSSQSVQFSSGSQKSVWIVHATLLHRGSGTVSVILETDRRPRGCHVLGVHPGEMYGSCHDGGVVTFTSEPSYFGLLEVPPLRSWSRYC